MLETLSRYWWAVVLRGVVAIIFGLLAIVWPGITVLALVILFGAYALVDGVFALLSAFRARPLAGARATGGRAWLVLEGIAGILLGILTFMWPGTTALVLLYLIAAWALVTGVLEVVAAVRLRREIRGEWLLALSGVLSVLFGILLIIWPGAGALALVVLIGAYAIIFGGVVVGLGLRLRRVRDQAASVVGRPATA